jgi:RES domain-containing protein
MLCPPLSAVQLTGCANPPAAPPQLAQIGDDLVDRQEHGLLVVTSALVSNEHNCRINPAHPEFKRINILDSQPVSYDPRMFRKPERRQRQ